MHDLIVHGKHEHAVEMMLKRSLELLSRLAIYVPRYALPGRVLLRLEAWHSEDGNAVRRQRTQDVGNESMLVALRDMFQYVEGVGGIELTGTDPDNMS
jgi:hypothetical protein